MDRAFTESTYIPTTIDRSQNEPTVAESPVSGHQIEEAAVVLEQEEVDRMEDDLMEDDHVEEEYSADDFEKEEEKAITKEEEKEVIDSSAELMQELGDTEEEDGFTEVTAYEERSEYESELPISIEVNSESFIVPEYNPAMAAYEKKVKKAPVKRRKPKKRSFFRRIREKVTVYLRKLTLSDIRFMGDDED